MRGSGKKEVPKINIMSLSMEAVQKDCREWARKIADNYSPDLIIFIAKSGYLFAEPLADYFKCEMVGISASRPASSGKDKLKGIIRLIPEKILLRILSSALMYRFHEKKDERYIEISERYLCEKKIKHRNILIVDDSVDTGWTLKQVVQEVEGSFPEAVIKTAAYSVIDYSRNRISVDFFRYENVVILTATSRKSKEYDGFITAYEKWLKHGV